MAEGHQSFALGDGIDPDPDAGIATHGRDAGKAIRRCCPEQRAERIFPLIHLEISAAGIGNLDILQTGGTRGYGLDELRKPRDYRLTLWMGASSGRPYRNVAGPAD